MDVRYKRSTKFECRSCHYPVTAVNGTRCELGKVCSPCLEGTRSAKMNWGDWKAGMKRALKRKTRKHQH